MPAVSVLPLRNPAVGGVSHEAHHGASLFEISMPDSAQPSGEEANKVNQTAATNEAKKKDGSSTEGTAPPSPSSASYPQGLPSHHLTPQQPGYYPENTAYQSQVTPEPPSPSTGTTAIYDMNSVLQQPTGFAPFAGHLYSTSGSRATGQHAPPSPSQSSVPPASPLFPRIVGTVGSLDPNVMHDGSNHVMHSSSSQGYHLSPVYAPMASYAAVTGSGSDNAPTTGKTFAGWSDRNQVSPYPPQSSPQIVAHGMPIPYVPGMPQGRSVSVSSRSYSFGDESMLPPPADSQSQADHYSFSQNIPIGIPGSHFPHHQQAAAWAYGGPPPDMYGASASPLQPRSTMQYHGMVGPPRHQAPAGMSPYGQFYPASSPGPPIQTTASNKGPDGANLFIFHIPNHFTNLDMFQLFCPYGNLLSVRIMVEKDTGRSRGFGFVSYDSPESAALAIKELNGFTVGNKRLKVQHKQIRDQERGQGYDAYAQGGQDAEGNNSSMSLPPPGPGGSGWYQQEQDEIGATPGATSREATDTAAEESGTIEGGVDPLSALEPLRQALPDAGATESE